MTPFPDPSAIEFQGLSGDARPALLARPATGDGPGVMLLVPLLDGAARSLCHRLAEDGYICLACTPAVDAEGLAGDIAAFRACQAIDGRIGIVAIGCASRVALTGARHGKVDGVVAYCGDGLSLADVDAFGGDLPLALHLGDKAAVDDNVRAFLRSAAQAGKLQFWEYPDQHADFADPTSAFFDRHAASVAYSRTLSVLRPVLGLRYDLARLFREHLAQEFVHRDADATMDTMVDQPYVNHVPTMTGGYGHEMLKRFYKYHFIPTTAADRQITLVSETVGADTVVLEVVNRFTHQKENDYMLPGVAPNGRQVEIAAVIVAKFRGDKLYHEHIYWDQASLLVQLGVIDPAGLPVTGKEQARKLLDPSLSTNHLMQTWQESEGLPT